MATAKQNKSIAKLIVGAMSIDGTLDNKERAKVASTLQSIGLDELIPDVGATIDDETLSFNMFEECKLLKASLGAEAAELAPMIFRVVTDVVASDRFVSSQEALYLSAMAKRLGISTPMAKQIFQEVIAHRRSRLEQSGKDIDAALNPHLKELLSFEGSEDLVGQADQDSLDDMLHDVQETLDESLNISKDDMLRALTILGLTQRATLQDAEAVWRETIATLELPKMAALGETFVSAALNRICRVNDAYKTILHFNEFVAEKRKVGM